MVTALAMAGVYLVLLGIVVVRRTRRNPAERWLIAYCAYSAALMGLHGLVLSGRVAFPPPISDQFVVGVGFIISVALASAVIVTYLGVSRRVVVGLGGAAAIWAAAAIALRLAEAPPLTVVGGWIAPTLADRVTLGTEITVFGWALLSVLVIGLVWWAYLREPLPIYANRILFWVVLAPALLGGDLLAAWLRPPWNTIGYIVRLVAAIAAVYSVVVLHLIDLREFARRMFSAAILTMLIAAVIFAAITLPAVVSFPGLGTSERWLLRAVTAIVVASMMVPGIQFLRWLLRGVLRPPLIDPTEVVRAYSERISGTVELEELAAAASQAIRDLLGARRTALILATHRPHDVRLEQVGKAGAAVGTVAFDSPIYQQFAGRNRALLQYVIDYDRRYIATPEAERAYFNGLGSDLYVPIVAERQLAGLLAVGPKVNDDVYRPAEIELLEALASQTVTALENARLVSDLRTLNERIMALNEDLKATNARLERLDEVKSDFLIIASHELRTPLTQIQGNAEMLLEIAEHDTLAEEREDALEMIQSLSRAARRLSDVVIAMLDMTQVDIDTMELVFDEVQLSEVVTRAVEPYADALTGRGQRLVVADVAGLPVISADRDRLVQALDKIVGNAIKYTPDGGRIRIEGSVYEKDDAGKPQSVLVCITDTGIGIDSEHHKLIFEKFYRAESSAFHSTGTTKFKGAGPGLGLAIAESIVEGHGGRIWVESDGCNEETCPGSTFNILLPVTPPAIEARKRIRKVQAAQHDTDIRKKEAETEADPAPAEG